MQSVSSVRLIAGFLLQPFSDTTTGMFVTLRELYGKPMVSVRLALAAVAMATVIELQASDPVSANACHFILNQEMHG